MLYFAKKLASVSLILLLPACIEITTPAPEDGSKPASPPQSEGEPQNEDNQNPQGNPSDDGGNDSSPPSDAIPDASEDGSSPDNSDPTAPDDSDDTPVSEPNDPEPEKPEERPKVDFSSTAVDPSIYRVENKMTFGEETKGEYLDSACGGVITSRQVNFSRNHEEGRVFISRGEPFPGMIVSAKALTTGSFDQFRPNRKPYPVFISGINALGKNSALVKEASKAATDDILSTLLYHTEDNNEPVLPARVSVDFIETYSEKQASMAMDLGASFKGFGFTAGSDDQSKESTRKLSVLITQHMYSYIFEPGTDDLNDFLDVESVEELTRGLDPEDQLAVISEVMYGRLIAISVEINARIESDSSKIGAAFKGLLENADLSKEQQNIVNSSRVSISVVGGGDLRFINPTVIKSGELYQIIQEFELGDDWSPRRSPGVPIGYVASFLQNQYPVMVVGRTTDYIEQKFDPRGGDDLWNLWSLGSDNGSKHIAVSLSGKEFFKRAHDKWPEVPSKIGEINGVLENQIIQDVAYKYGTHVFSENIMNVALRGERGVVTQMFVNDKLHVPSRRDDGSYLFNFQLQPGWNSVHVTDGSQAGSHWLEMDGISKLPVTMDSNACGSKP